MAVDEHKKAIAAPDVESAQDELPQSRRGSRVDKPKTASIAGTDADSGLSVGQQIELEKGNAIKYRTCSWQKTAALLFSEYICLAIMSFPWSYSVLGLVPGLILTVVQAAIVLYTSLVLWEFCLRHPEVKDVCDIGQLLLGGGKWGWWFTAVMFLLNNTFIQGLHCLVGAKYLNTMSGHTVCTVGFSAIIAVISWFCSLPRTFSSLSHAATLSAVFTFFSVMLAAIFAWVEDHPAGYPKFGEPTVLAFPPAGTTFVTGLSAFLNISYTFIGTYSPQLRQYSVHSYDLRLTVAQITLPSFIAEMEKPKDFPKALWAVTIAEIIVFSLVGSLIYAKTGAEYVTAPAFGSLGNDVYKKVAFSLAVPTIIFLGILYAVVSARFIFFNIFQGTKHLGNHTVVGWASWGGILAVTWVLAFIIAEVIPFFSDLLSLMSSLFDSFFGNIFWALAYFRMRKLDYGPDFWKTRGWRGYLGFAVNIFIIGVGLLFLGPGTYVTVQSIIDGYRANNFGGAFSCASNGFESH